VSTPQPGYQWFRSKCTEPLAKGVVLSPRILKLFLILLLLGIFLCCGKQPTEPVDDRPWYLLTDEGVTWSPDGKMLAYDCSGDGVGKVPEGLYVVDLSTLKRRLVIPGGGRLSGPDWSPDGRWIAFSLNRNIYKITPDGDSLTQLTYGEWEFFPQWSPAGQSIAYHRNLGIDGGVFSTSSSGEGAFLIIKWAQQPAWFPDKQHLAIQVWDSSHVPQVAAFNIADSTIEVLTNDNMIAKSYLRISPDGTKILFTAQEKTTPPRFSLFTVEVATHKVERLVTGGHSGAWSPDGRYLAYSNPYEGAIYVRDLQTGTQTRVSPGALIFAPEWDSLGFPREGM